MNTDTGMAYQSSNGPTGSTHWRGCASGEPWKLIEVLAMVMGFIVFWPLGVAVIGWKFWQRKSGYQGDIVTFGREKVERDVGRWTLAHRSGSLAGLRLWHGLDRQPCVR